MVENVKENGKLFICATPIGNLGDITLRALETLKEVDIIAAEDTRTTSKLLSHYNISKQLQSYKGFAEEKSTEKIIRILKEGKKVALVSEAGLPGISDPGYKLIVGCIERQISIEVLPGASAFTAALVYSGLPSNKFWFEGFLPKKKEQKKQRLIELSNLEGTLIFYESPRRLISTLETISRYLGNKKIAVTRELTKKFEEILRGNVDELLDEIKKREQVKGEMVIVVEGAPRTMEIADLWIEEKISFLTNLGIAKKDTVKIISSLFKINKSRVFDIAERATKHKHI